MRPIGEVSSRFARRAAALAETRRGTGIVFVAALAVWWMQALVIPLAAGRDFGTYLGAYVQLFQSDPIDLGYVLNRTPLSPLVSGGLLDFAHGALAEPAVSLLYAASITAWFLAARSFGGVAALLTAVVLLAWPGYGILFHELGGDMVFAAAFAGWSLLAVRVLLTAPAPGRLALLGVGVGLLALVRPGNQVLVVLALVPLALRASWRTRLISVLAFAVPAMAVMGLWTLHNGVRFDNYTFSRGGNATVPFFRTFVTDKLVRPENGAASRELAQAVERRLLPKEPYRSYGITLERFFAEPSPRMQEDLVALSDRVRGWRSNHRWLRDVGVEAVRAHPADYGSGVARSLWGSVRQALYRPLGGGGASTGGEAKEKGGRRRRSSSRADGCRNRRRASRSRRRTRGASRLPTAASTRSGRRLPSTISSSCMPATRRGTKRSTGGWASWRAGCPTGPEARRWRSGSTRPLAGSLRRRSGSRSASARWRSAAPGACWRSRRRPLRHSS